MLDEVEEFLTGARGQAADTDRLLATVLFTDIVQSTERAVKVGEFLASRTVKDLVAGSSIGFTDRGTHRLKDCRTNGSCSPCTPGTSVQEDVDRAVSSA
jgi:hypothetical protein